MEVLELEMRVKRGDIKAQTVGIDLDAGLRAAIQSLDFSVCFDVMHVYRAWYARFAESQGTTVYNKLKMAGVDLWWRSFQEVFSLVLFRHDLVPRAARQIRGRMEAIIRLAKDGGKIDEGIFNEGSKFLGKCVDKYLT